MTRLIIHALVALAITGAAGSGYARDKSGTFAIYSDYSCSEYLDAYSRRRGRAYPRRDAEFLSKLETCLE